MEAKRHHGLIIGKFLPPHEGHLHLVREAAKRCQSLTVLVCTLEREPIPGELRFEWMRELCPEARVVHVRDENPQYPHEHPDFWAIWRDTILRHTPEPIDVVFSSEEYGDELARALGATHVCIDLQRETVPISGTAVRDDPFGNWRFIPLPVRRWFTVRVVLTGSECTGKTTLAPLLAAQFAGSWSEEYGREFVDRHGMPNDLDDVERIARGQIENEDRAVNEGRGIVFHDTDLFSTVVYSRHYFGDVPPWVAQAAVKRQGDLYLLAGLDVPWVADGAQRDRGHMREEMQQLFRDELTRHGVRFVELQGSVEERAAVVRRELDALTRGTGLRGKPLR